VKVLVLVVLLVIAYLLPNKVMIWYGYSCMFGATFFLFIQIILLVDFAYDWNDKWVAKEWLKPVVLSAGVIYLASLIGVILMYVWFGRSTSCGLNIFITTFIALLCVVATFLSIRNDIQRGSLLTSSVVTGFCIYLCFSAMLVSTNDSCNPFPPTAPTRLWIMIIGVILAIISICYNTIANASQRGVFQLTTKEEEMEDIQSSHDKECYNFSYFHLVFACGAMYMAMLYSGWNLSYAVIQGQFDIGPASMWIKVVSSWITVLLYIWSMVGPIFFPNRDWS